MSSTTYVAGIACRGETGTLTGMTISVGEPRTGWVADDSTFGARLALIRQRMGWGNVKEGADACGLPAESWRRWERDGRAPRDVVQIAEKISDVTGCDLGWLLAGSRLRGRERNLDISHRLVTRYDNSGPLRRVPTLPRRPPRGPSGNTRPTSRADSSRRATAISR